MTDFFSYLLYAFAFIAVVLGVEGVWFAVRSHLGEERRVNRRLATGLVDKPRVAGETRFKELEQWLHAHVPSIEAALRRARGPISASQLVLAAAALALAVFATLSLVGAPTMVAAVAAVAIGVAAPVGLLSLFIRRCRRRFLDQLPQAVDLIARSLQVGHPVTAAMSVVGEQMSAPIGPEFGEVIEEITYGLDRDEALANLVRRFPVPELKMFVASMQITRESGGNLSEVFLKLAECIRAKSHLRRKVEAISAEGRLSFWVVTALPVVVGGALIALRPTFYTDVIHDPLFWPMMSFAPITLTIGAIIIWRFVNIRI